MPVTINYDRVLEDRSFLRELDAREAVVHLRGTVGLVAEILPQWYFLQNNRENLPWSLSDREPPWDSPPR